MRNRYILAGDALLIVLAAFGAFALRFDWRFYLYEDGFIPFVIAALLVKPPVFYAFGLYQRLWRYASVAELTSIAAAVLASSTLLAVGLAAVLWWRPEWGFSRAVPLIDALLTLVLVGGLRLSVRVLAEAGSHPGAGTSPERRVLIAGAGDAGVMVLREIQRNPQLRLVAVGFLDDDSRKHGKRIHGVKVLGALDAVGDLARRHRVDEVLITMPKSPGTVVRSVAERCQAVGVPHRTMPGVYELLDGQVSVSRLRQVDITDLLRRQPFDSLPGSEAYLTGATVVVTGAGGSIGSELCRQVAHAHPATLVMIGQGENSIFETALALTRAFPRLRIVQAIANVRDRVRIERLFEQHRPSVVFHAAAHKHVPLMEHNPEEAISNNVLGTLNVVRAAERVGAERFVLISTDKAVSPSSIMGASKRIAECVVRRAGRRNGRAFVVVRFGNVLGSRGSVVPQFKSQIESGGPVCVTDPEMRRYFMTIPEAVRLVVQAGGFGRGGELYVLNMGEPVRVVDLAKDLIHLSGLTLAQMPIVFTGIRPGEKLAEELWESGAGVSSTAHPDVRRVSEPELWTDGELDAILDELAAAVASGDPLAVQSLVMQRMATVVPALTRTGEFLGD